MKSANEQGSHLIVALVVVTVLGIIGFSGYRVWMMQQTAAQGSSSTQQPSAVPQVITNTAGLTEVANVLGQASAQVNASLDDSALNTDLNSML